MESEILVIVFGNVLFTLKLFIEVYVVGGVMLQNKGQTIINFNNNFVKQPSHVFRVFFSLVFSKTQKISPIRAILTVRKT